MRARQLIKIPKRCINQLPYSEKITILPSTTMEEEKLRLYEALVHPKLEKLVINIKENHKIKKKEIEALRVIVLITKKSIFLFPMLAKIMKMPKSFIWN